MDVNTDLDHNIESHYEYTASKSHNLMILKARVLNNMRQLEGWCSNEKASILIDIIAELKPETIVEIGVWGGKSLIPMAYALNYNGKGKIYGVDPWSTQESAEGMDGVNHTWWSSVDHVKILKGLQVKIQEFHLQDQIVLIRTTSEHCPVISDIDILHIDGNHSDKASFLDVIKWVPLVKSGGLIIFDDVNWATTNRATAWLNENCIKIAEYKGDNIWGIWAKP